MVKLPEADRSVLSMVKTLLYDVAPMFESGWLGWLLSRNMAKRLLNLAQLHPLNNPCADPLVHIQPQAAERFAVQSCKANAVHVTHCHGHKHCEQPLASRHNQ